MKMGEFIQGERGADRGAVLTGLAGNMVLFVGLPLVLNGLIFGLGWERSSGPQTGLPPGWVVGAIWLVLFAGMGIARWLLLRAAVTRGDVNVRRVEWVSLLAFLCLLYPLYTAGFSNLFDGLVGNVLTLVVAVPVAVYGFRRVRAAGAWLVPLCAWLAYAAWATARLVYR
ncbi:MAG: TspO/MBR family protein [Acidobacteriaceae bacterium]